MTDQGTEDLAGLDVLHGPVRRWFRHAFPGGPTPAQQVAWPAIASGDNTLLVAPTGNGKTLAAFLAILDRLFLEHEQGQLGAGLRCVYISPLRSLGYDIQRNLAEPLDLIRLELGLNASPVGVGVRTGDTSPHQRRRLRERPPHILITTPESLSLLLSQPAWTSLFRTVDHVIIDEVHALVPTKRGADLAVSIERLSECCHRDPTRVGLSATCRPAEPVARFLVGPDRACTVLEPGPPDGRAETVIDVRCLLEPDEAPHRGLTYRRLLRHLGDAISAHRTTIVFANTRAFTEKLTHDLRPTGDEAGIAAHHSALDAAIRRDVESRLKLGELRAVVTSTSLELGVDIGTADLAVLVGLPGSAARCLQRVGRAGHRVDAATRGLMLAATPAELAGAAVTACAARAGKIEPLRSVSAPLDVLCQQLVSMACAGECDTAKVHSLLRRTAPFADLTRADLDACLDFLAGDLAAPPGAFEPEPGATPKWTSPRLWRARGFFGIRSRRTALWFRSNVGTINSEETLRVVCDGRPIGTVESEYAERLAGGDRFVLDGRALEFRRIEGLVVHTRPSAGDPGLPLWKSDRQSLSAELTDDLVRFRDEAARRLIQSGPPALRSWLRRSWRLRARDAEVLVALFEAQARLSEVPKPAGLLVESAPTIDGLAHTFHVPLPRAACEALGRALAARLGRRLGSNLTLSAADLGFTVHQPSDVPLDPVWLHELLIHNDFEIDVLEGLDRGELLASRFRHVAATALMVLKNPEGGRTRVGGLRWVSQRLYPLVKAACPNHPLLRETRREVLDDILDAPRARAWLESCPEIRHRHLDAPSPFALAWIDPATGSGDALAYEAPEAALKRLHARIMEARP